MANSLVVRKGTDLAKRIKALRAAQYVRMSTDHQRYSIQNQAAAIATYAQERHFNIVRTYIDEGRSGLRIKGRAGLIELIGDVESGRADFDHVLVYDVSRWGRFQDIDESAHYEFICKQNGVSVEYCAEQFENDGSLLSSIVKNIKRVMAAEFSRELSIRVHAGQCRIVSLGYRVGGPLNFALRRELIGEDLVSKGQLSKGQHKALQTDRVRHQLGSDEEADIVRRIFHLFVDEGRSGADVARQLNEQKLANHHGRLWTEGMVQTILRNENYIGNIVFNRMCYRLGQRRTSNPHNQWVRCEGIIAPIIDRRLFARAQELLDNRYISISEEQMLVRLRTTLAKKGKLNTQIVNNTPGLPCAASFCDHFGSLRKAYDLIGYSATRDCDWIDSRLHWSKILMEHATLIVRALEIGLPQNDGKNGLRLRLDQKNSLTLMVARQSQRLGQWRVYRRLQPSPGLLVLLRLDRSNKMIFDYLLMPAPKIRRYYLFLSDASLGRLNAVCFETANALVREIKRRHRSLRR